MENSQRGQAGKGANTEKEQRSAVMHGWVTSGVSAKDPLQLDQIKPELEPEGQKRHHHHHRVRTPDACQAGGSPRALLLGSPKGAVDTPSSQPAPCPKRKSEDLGAAQWRVGIGREQGAGGSHL